MSITTSIRRHLAPLSVTLAAAAAGLLQGCSGVVPNDADDEAQAQAFYNEKLHSEDEKACNSGGAFYDNIGGECVGSVKLAGWACTRSNVEAQLTQRGTLDANGSALGQLDDYLKAGYEMHQCGEDGDTIIALLVRKGRNGQEATLEMQRVVFDGSDRPKLQFSYDVHAPGAIGDCQQSQLELWGTVGTGGDARREEVPASADVTVQLTVSPSDKVKIYADAECKSEIANAVIAAGKSSLLFFYEFSAVGRSTLEAQADGYGPAVTSVIEGREPSDVSDGVSAPGEAAKDPAESKDNDSPAVEAVNGYLELPQGGAIPHGTCQPLDVLHIDEADETGTQTVAANSDISVSVLVDNESAAGIVTIYEDAGCTMIHDHVTLAAGSEKATVYYKFSAVGTAEVYAKSGDGDYKSTPTVTLEAN